MAWALIMNCHAKLCRWFWVVGLGTFLLWPEPLAAAAAPLAASMPQIEDFAFLWWAEGAPYYRDTKAPPPTPVLCFASGRLGLAIETKTLRLLHLGRFEKPLDRDAALERAGASVRQLPAMNLKLSVEQVGKSFVCHGRGEIPRDEFFFPVRFVESGHFFQRATIEGLEFVTDGGELLSAPGRVEIAFWPDHLVLSAELDEKAGTNGVLALETGTQRITVPLHESRRVSLSLLDAAPPPQAGVSVESSPGAVWDGALGCWKLHLPETAWSNRKGTYYPEEHLDRLDRQPFKLRNPTDHDVAVPLMFMQEQHLPITGFTPMLCDADGFPTGLPVQISKNWHQRPEKGRLPHQGPWFHGCAFVRLPPHSERELVLAMTYARWGGLPAASHAQLSLVGWGHNQFWDEAALGSFGESICFEPGRVQRRCMIDDVRPFLTLPTPEAKPWGWANNAGGGDYLVWFDPAGRYQGFRETRTDYRAYGPCLTEVVYHEESLGGEISARMGVSLARSDDYLRVFHHLRYDVHQPVRWQRLAFHQLGADFYNEPPSRQVAVGDAGGVGEEWTPVRTNFTYDRQGVVLRGPQPWISIHGLERSALGKGVAAASRGLVVRSWKAVLGGKPAPVPCASFYATEWGKGNHRTVVELVPPPEVTALQPGDYLDAEIEWVVFPTDPTACYSPNRAFQAALAHDADTWRLVHREARDNALRVEVQRGTPQHTLPLSVAVDAGQRAELTLDGGVGCVPVTFSGLTNYRDWELRVNDQPLDQSIHGHDFWQTDYDSKTRQWKMTFNVPRDGTAPTRLVFQPR